MGYITGMILLVVASFVLMYLGRRFKQTNTDASQRNFHGGLSGLTKHLSGIGVGVLIVGSLVLTLPNSINQIKAGHVGVVYQFGDIVGQVDSGLNFVLPWRNIREASVQTVGHHFKRINAFSSETQDVFVAATLNLNISPAHIQKLYRTVGPGWFETLVVPRVNQFFKDETVKYKSVAIAPAREEIRKHVTERLATALRNDSITVSDLLVDDIDFKPEFKASIENKQMASQNALAEEQKIAGATHKAAQKVAEARGEGEAILIKATKQAEANMKLANSISPNLISYMSVEKLSPNIQVMMVPSGQGMIMGPEFLNKKQAEKVQEK
jgi:regulator of protease activity HflC (stomatin/prohibitin superfamily)